jgi:hypothetical protein
LTGSATLPNHPWAASGTLNQEGWAEGDRRDLELDDAESGIADQDGQDEQVPFRDWQMVGMV